MSSFIRKKYEVHLICYNFNYSRWKKILKCSDQDITQSVDLPGMIFHIIPPNDSLKERTTNKSLFQRIFYPEISDFYHSFYVSSKVNEEITEIDPDIVFAYTSEAIVAVTWNMQEKKFKLIGLIVDLDHLVRKYRRKYSSDYSIQSLGINSGNPS